MTEGYANRKWIDSGRGLVMVEWSAAYGSWYYLCPAGCLEADFEGTAEAVAAFEAHSCRGLT